MSWKVSKTRQAAACGLLALFGAAFAVQADDGSVRPAAARYHTLMNGTVVAVDAEAGTLTVNGGTIGKEHTFTVAAEARQAGSSGAGIPSSEAGHERPEDEGSGRARVRQAARDRGSAAWATWPCSTRGPWA